MTPIVLAAAVAASLFRPIPTPAEAQVYSDHQQAKAPFVMRGYSGNLSTYYPTLSYTKDGAPVAHISLANPFNVGIVCAVLEIAKVDGEVGHSVRPFVSDPTQVGRFHLAPKETAREDILLNPLSGANSPALPLTPNTLTIAAACDADDDNDDSGQGIIITPFYQAAL